MSGDLDLVHSLQEVANSMLRDNQLENESRAGKRKFDQESADDTRRGSNKRMNSKVADMSGHLHHDSEALQDYKPYSENGMGEHASTAQAALGVYPMPTMTIPQATDVSFGQASESDRNQDSYLDNSQQAGDSFMESSTPSGRGTKPAVGSDEWHKVRKDNHKEGKFALSNFSKPKLTMSS